MISLIPYLMVALLTAVSAMAGDAAGNGGDVVVCKKDGTLSYRVLDYFEAEHAMPPVLPSLGSDGSDPLTKVLYALERIRFIDEKRYSRYEREATTFFDKVDKWIESGPALEDISDSGNLELPAGCKLMQAAIRRKPFHPSIKPYLVDKRIWDKLNDTDRAGLILHEIIYGEMFQLGHETSSKARRYTALVSSEIFESISAEQYQLLVNDLFKIVYPPVFRSQEFDVNAKAGKIFVLELRSLLQHPVESQLRWSTLEPLPDWLLVDHNREMLIGTPPTNAADRIIETMLVVRDNNKGAIAKLRVRVR